METLRKFVSMHGEKAELKKQLSLIEGQLKDMEEEVTNYMIENGLDHVALDGKTIYVSSRRTAKALNMPALVTAFEELGLSSMVSVNSRSLLGFVNDMLNNDIPIPAEVASNIEVGEMHSVSVRSR